MDNAIGGYMTYKPTLRERFWHNLGFRYHLGEEPEGTEGLEGWQQTKLLLGFSWSDRLRLLLTGRLKVVLTQQTDTPSPTIIATRMDWQIAAPGQSLRN